MAKKTRREMTPDELRAYMREKQREHRARRTPEQVQADRHKDRGAERARRLRAERHARGLTSRGTVRQAPRTRHPPKAPRPTREQMAQRAGAQAAEGAARAILRDAVALYREGLRNLRALEAQGTATSARLESARRGVRAMAQGVREAQAELLRVQGKTSR